MTPPDEPARHAVSRRKPLPGHLPPETHITIPELQGTHCGGIHHHLGEDVSKVLECVPARFKVISHLRPKWVCRCSEHTAQMPAPPGEVSGALGYEVF